MIPQRESPLAGRLLYLVCCEPTLEPLYENTAHTGVNGENERAARGSQLTRVVPPNFSVPFEGAKGPAFLFCGREKPPGSYFKVGQGALQKKEKEKVRHG